ncbi:CoA pyrophosphatase [Parahaliea mediterranea]|uniref:CoA pyrophosphatase n=2 Tax=Parahaliea mediterranea TaxID=651086 RepID=A0A939IPJ1_9GAMM|nr:CoA pyrophosphatase [Parahaliea mediterranea]MBN7799112.1 CoA pyrophosphatase [Parahaliea mediterranea]
MRRSAVAMILSVRQGELHILMIKRAERKGDPWSGHMAFPGGRMDPEDANGFEVANRETEEEVGIRLGDCASCIGRLSDIRASPRGGLLGMAVTPFVFRLEREVRFRINHEVAEVVWVPLEFLLDTDRRESMTWARGKVNLTLPCYFYQGRRIWGLSLMMLDELMDLVEGRNPLRKVWRRG